MPSWQQACNRPFSSRPNRLKTPALRIPWFDDVQGLLTGTLFVAPR